MRIFFCMNTVRTAKSVSDPEFVSIGRPYSMFEFVDGNFIGLDSLRRIMSQVRVLGGLTMVVEKLEHSGDIIEENEDLLLRTGVEPESVVTRLSFFTKGFTTHKGLSTVGDEQFLGYAVIKSDTMNGETEDRIYESVLLYDNHPNHCVRGQPKWKCRIDNVPLNVEGYLYAQQNGLTNVCAHVALRSAISGFHPSNDISYREINKILGIDHVTRKVGNGKGLSLYEMVTVLEQFGARCVVGDYITPSAMSVEVPFHKYVYGSMESGFPSLLAFKTNSGSGHVIPVFGHTFNPDTWVCNAEQCYFKVSNDLKYIPSESWLSMYLAHDDNFGSNFCIPRRYLTSNAPKSANEGEESGLTSEGSVACVIGTLPWDVKLMPIQAEIVGADYLFALLPHIPVSEIWEHRFKWHAENNQMVLRSMLVTKSEYIKHLSRVRDWEWNRIDRSLIKTLNDNLNEGYYWLVELSLPELFSANRRKVAEVLLYAEDELKTIRDFKSFSLARLPDHFAFYDGGGASNPRYLFIESGINGHVELYGCEEG